MLLDFIQIEESQIVMLSITAFIIGVAKMGFPGLNIIPIIIMIYLYGPFFSLGFSLLVGYASDLQAVYAHRKHINFGIFWRFIVWNLIGVIVSGIIGNIISVKIFKILVAVLIIFSACLLAYREFTRLRIRRNNNSQGTVAEQECTGKPSTLFSAFYGTIAGSSSMLSNASAPFTSFYLLRTNIATPNFMGTSALLYLCYNTIKIIIHVFLWKSIILITLLQTLTFLPFALLGAIITKTFVYKVPQQIYRWSILLFTALSGIGLLLTVYL